MYNLANINVTLPIEMLLDLANASQKSGIPINDLCYGAIRAYLSQAEDFNNREKISANSKANIDRLQNAMGIQPQDYLK
jgi:hypothetical protein